MFSHESLQRKMVQFTLFHSSEGKTSFSHTFSVHAYAYLAQRRELSVKSIQQIFFFAHSKYS